MRVSFLNLEIIFDYGRIGLEALKKEYKIQYIFVYKDQNNRLQQLQAYEDIIKQTYLSSSIPGGNNLLAVTALDKSLSGSVLLESSVSSMLREQIKNMKNFDYRNTMQRCRWVFKSGWASSNVVGIICPPGCSRVN